MDFPAKPTASQWTSGIRIKNRACAKIDDPNVGVREKRTNGSDYEIAPSPHGQHGRGFRHAVTFEHRDANEVEKLIHMRLKRTASGNGSAKFTADNRAEFFKNEAIEKLRRDNGNQPKPGVLNGQAKAFPELPAMHVELLSEKESLSPLHISRGSVGEMKQGLAHRWGGFHIREDF